MRASSERQECMEGSPWVIAFRRLFRRIWLEFTLRLDRSLAARAVDPRERLTRHIFSTRHFSTQKARVKPEALMPPPENLETSVFRTANLSEPVVWELGDLFVGAGRGKKPIARADLRASKVQESGLRLRPDSWPARHANITGWPKEKDERMDYAQLLAADAALVLRLEA